MSGEPNYASRIVTGILMLTILSTVGSTVGSYMKGEPLVVERTFSMVVLDYEQDPLANLTTFTGMRQGRTLWWGTEDLRTIEVRGLHDFKTGRLYYLTVSQITLLVDGEGVRWQELIMKVEDVR